MTRLSNRQYPTLKIFIEAGKDFYMSQEEARKIDQRPFRSMLLQGWVAWRPGRGFHATREGRDAWEEFIHTDIARKNPNLPLTALFDPTAHNLRIIRPRHAAA